MQSRKEKQMPRQQQKDKLTTIDNDFNFRISMFKKVFGTDEGKLVLDYLGRVWSLPVPSFNPNSDYWVMGKYRAYQEICKLVNTPLKKGHKDE